MGIKIRRFDLSDLEKVAEIDKFSFLNPRVETYFKKLYKEHPRDFLVAEIAGKVVGYILGYVKSDKTGLIKTLAIDPNYRRRGIGKKLVSFIIKKFKEKSVKDVFLHSRTKNQPASSFYKKLGFRIIKIIKNYYRNGDDAYLMKKEI